MSATNRAAKKTPKNFQDLPPIRVRREPPTVEEAVAAAQDLASDVEQQVEITAGLMGLPPDAVRPHVLSAKPKPSPARIGERGHERQERILNPAGPSRPPRTVVVERRSRPTVLVERRSRPLEPRR